MNVVIIYISQLLSSLISLYSFAVLLRAILSWIVAYGSTGGLYQFYEFIFKITEPPLKVVRTLIFKVFPKAEYMPVDFSPIVLFLLIDILIMPLIQVIFAVLFNIF